MQHFIRKHPVRSILLTLLVAYGLWWLYTDYELTAYPRRIAANLPVVPSSIIIRQREVSNTLCRTGSVLNYYATNLSWEEVIAFYQNNLNNSSWEPRGNLSYKWNQSANNQRLNLYFHHIDTPQDTMEQEALSSGATGYILTVAYTQSEITARKNCTPED
ncbi:hypothetical protein [Kouleothrix sp.]|uniref:hypothetical protein n=1 Tax=Kouleothrix sp. TaxID=2779161 RepID=UPI00391A60AA